MAALSSALFPPPDENLCASLKQILNEYSTTALSPAGFRQFTTRIRQFESACPEQFFRAAVSFMETESDSPGRRRLGVMLVKSPAFLRMFCDAKQFTPDQRLQICTRLMESDPCLDIELAHQLPGAYNLDCELDTEVIVTVLDLLDRISPRERLIPVLQHLTRHSEPRVASRAALLLGHRVRNPRWIEEHLARADHRLRANVIEGLWGLQTPAARATLEACLSDANNRVVGNALIGLALLGDEHVPALLRQMITDPRTPFRQTAAWVMGRIAHPDFEEQLRLAAADPDPGVRKTAQRALEAYLRDADATASRAPTPG